MMDTMQVLLESAHTRDSLEYWSPDPFLYVRSGNLVAADRKHALVIHECTDTTMLVDFYELTSPATTSSRSSFLEMRIPFPLPCFGVEFTDINGDGTKDIFIRQSSSNGIVMQRGRWFTVDATHEPAFLTPHPETDSLCNLRMNNDHTAVLADSLIWCRAQKDLCTVEYRWQNDSFVRISASCPCVGDNE